MKQTLKSNFQKKSQLNERKLLIKNDVKITKIIKENFDKSTADKSIQLIKRLNAVKWPGQLSSFKNATKSAIAELQRVLAGNGRDKGLFDKLVNLFKRQSDNPFIDVLAYASAVNSFFKTLNKYVEASNDGNAQSIGDLFVDNQEAFYAIVKKGLTPDGMISKISTNWKKKYLKDDQLQNVADQLLALPMNEFKTLAKNVTEQLSDINNVANVVASTEQAVTSGQAAPVDKSTNPGEQEKAPEQTTQTTSTTPDNVKSGHQNNASLKQKVINRVKPALQDLGVKDVEKLIDTLEDLGVIKEP